MSSINSTDERQRIHDATQKLLAGTPQRSNGKLTVSNLAIEARLSRQRLYEHHPTSSAPSKRARALGPSRPISRQCVGS